MKVRCAVLCMVIVCLITACGAKEPLDPPAEAYHNFFRACEKGDIAEAETYLSQKAIDELEVYRAEAAKLGEDDPLREYFLQWGDPCQRYKANGVNPNGIERIEIESDTPDAIRYWEYDSDEYENHSGEYSGYDVVLEMAALQWFIEGKIDPLGENPPNENTTYISTIEVMMVKIDGEWKIDCGWC